VADPAYADTLERWRALASDPARIPDLQEQAARRAARAELARSFGP
jgi:hypothetical protein